MLALIAGVVTYRALPVELFPEIEFPLITVSTFYPSGNPEAVVRDVAEPIESAISGVDGLKNIQSLSFENSSLVLANFEFGIDMAEAERAIQTNVNGIVFPNGVNDPIVARINPDEFPILQLSILGDRDILSLSRIVDTLIVPKIEEIAG